MLRRFIRLYAVYTKRHAKGGQAVPKTLQTSRLVLDCARWHGDGFALLQPFAGVSSSQTSGRRQQRPPFCGGGKLVELIR